MLSASPHYERSVLLTGEGLHQIFRGQHHAIPPRQHVGCSGDCADGAACNCSHAQAWRAPRQPRVRPKRRSRWNRVLRDLLRWLRSPRAW